MSACLERGSLYNEHVALWRSVQRLSVRKRAAECPALEPTSHTWRAGWCPITARAPPRSRWPSVPLLVCARSNLRLERGFIHGTRDAFV